MTRLEAKLAGILAFKIATFPHRPFPSLEDSIQIEKHDYAEDRTCDWR